MLLFFSICLISSLKEMKWKKSSSPGFEPGWHPSQVLYQLCYRSTFKIEIKNYLFNLTISKTMQQTAHQSWLWYFSRFTDKLELFLKHCWFFFWETEDIRSSNWLKKTGNEVFVGAEYFCRSRFQEEVFKARKGNRNWTRAVFLAFSGQKSLSCWFGWIPF